jgi:DNA-binding HxlR family transcriptional regulator
MDDLIASAIGLVSGKWKVSILAHLAHGPIRYSELHRLLPLLSTKVLTQQLRALEGDGLLVRRRDPASPKGIAYLITPRGATLWECLQHVGRWAENHHTARLAAARAGGARCPITYFEGASSAR